MRDRDDGTFECGCKISRDDLNTKVLLEGIKRILDSEDLDPFRAPELQYPQEIRLARFFIDRLQEFTKDNDAGLVLWLEQKVQDTADLERRAVLTGLIDSIRDGSHWKWIQKQKGHVVDNADGRGYPKD